MAVNYYSHLTEVSSSHNMYVSKKKIIIVECESIFQVSEFFVLDALKWPVHGLLGNNFLIFDDPLPPLIGPGLKFPAFLVWKASRLALAEQIFLISLDLFSLI